MLRCLLAFLLFEQTVAQLQCDTTLQRECVANGGSWGTGRTCCTCSRPCASGSADPNTCACTCATGSTAMSTCTTGGGAWLAAPDATTGSCCACRAGAATGCAAPRVFDQSACSCECPATTPTAAACALINKIVDNSTCSCVCDARAQQTCLLNKGVWDANKCSCGSPCSKVCATSQILDAASCTCRCATQCATGQTQNPDTCACTSTCSLTATSCPAPKVFDAARCTCACDPARAAACVAPNVFSPNTCTCGTGTTTCMLTAASCPAPKVFDAAKCTCACDPMRAAACAAPNVFNADRCTCDTPTTCSLTATSCPAPKVFDAVKCTCACDPMRAAACAAPNIFNADTCTCGTGTTTCSLTAASCAAPRVFVASTCTCACQNVCTGGLRPNPNTCTCDTACPSTAADDCKLRGGVFMATTCQCVQSTCDLRKQQCDAIRGVWDATNCACSGGCSLTTMSCAAGQLFDPANCACVTAPTCSTERRAACATLGGTFDATLCTCTPPPPACDAALKTACVAVAGNKFDDSRCVCLAAPPPTCDTTTAAAIADRCRAAGLTLNVQTCQCDVLQCDLAALSARCAPPGVVNARACLCETTVVTPPTCDRTALELACKQRGLPALPAPQCGCQAATTQCSDDSLRACDQLNAAGMGLFRANPMLCVCDEICPDGSLVGDAKARCSAGQTFDRVSCSCSTTTPVVDACTRRMLDRAAVEKRCADAKLRFDASVCACVDVAVNTCTLTTASCPNGIDVANCACLASPCALSPDRATLVAAQCTATAGYAFNRETCTCDQICTEGDFKGLAVAAVFARCIAAGGAFARPCTCSFPMTSPQCTIKSCPLASQIVAPDCTCADICPDGRLYRDAKQRCVTAGGAFDPASCSCALACTGDALTAARARCAKVPGATLNAMDCSCTLPKTCEQASAAVADVRLECAQRGGYQFDPATCECKQIQVEPTCAAGAERDCLSKPGAAFDSQSCTCRARCAATDPRAAMTAAAAACPDGQAFDAATCSCVATCVDRRADVAAQSCATGQLFDRSACACIEVCPVDKARVAAAACTGVFDFLTCECRPRAADPCGANADALKKRCESIAGYTFNAMTCACSAQKKIQITIKSSSLDEALKQRIQLLLKACDVSYAPVAGMTNTFDVTFGSLDAMAGNCAVDAQTLVKQVGADDSIASAELKDSTLEINVTAAPHVNGAASVSVAALCGVVASLAASL